MIKSIHTQSYFQILMEWRSIYLGDFSSNNIVVVFTDEDSVVSITYSNTGKLLQIILEAAE